jgi:hypothetical protein
MIPVQRYRLDRHSGASRNPEAVYCLDAGFRRHDG